jgi:hypothetical protein
VGEHRLRGAEVRTVTVDLRGALFFRDTLRHAGGDAGSRPSFPSNATDGKIPP